MSGLFQKGKAWGWAVLIFVACWAAGPARAAEWFVATNGSDAAAGTSWATAKLTIQAAVDVAVSNDTVWVSNGVYATGGRAVYGSMTNRVVIDKPIAVQSVNGPAVTVIKGAWDPVVTNGNAAVRCAYVGTNATLIGFTLTNGATHYAISSDSREFSGGGVWCEASGVVSNSVLTGNTADYQGGGSFGGTLIDCTLTGNSAWKGGGSCSNTLHRCSLTGNSAYMGGGAAYSAMNNCSLIGNTADTGGGSAKGNLNNCSLIGNIASSGGGSNDDTLNNCIVYYNAAGYLPNYVGSTFTYSCTTPLPEGEGNITNEPWMASASHLSARSPCIGVGNSAYVSGTDLDGETWFDPPSMGCDEVVAGSITGTLNVGVWAAHTNVAVGVPVAFRADIDGRTMASVWQWADGSLSSNQPYALHAFPSGGIYEVTVTAYNESNPFGVSATIAVAVPTQTTYYVRSDNPTSLAPYTSWASAAMNIQDAIDAVPYGGRDLVLVSNGVYATGGRVWGESMLTNRVVIDKAITVQSVNGPSVTTIKGARHPGTTNGNAAVRCVYVGTNAVLSGFTLTNGATRTGGGDPESSGGGAFVDTSGVLTNCILTANSADMFGGGAYGWELYNCRLSANAGRYGGGSAFSTLYNCRLESNSALLGGGSEFGLLTNCILIGNSAAWGGGCADGFLYSCILTKNSATQGGGSYYCRLNNCTVVSNSTGSYHDSLTNCIVYCNVGNNHASSTFNYCCTIPAPGGTGNITNDPSFVNAATGNYRLRTNSPCINRGNNADVRGETDLDGNPRIAFGTVDLGAYEAQFPVGYWAWAAAIANGMTNEMDCAAGDGMPNLLRYAAGGHPTEADGLARLDLAFDGGLPTLLFNRNTNATDVTLVIQGADEMSDGAAWRDLATNRNGSWGGAANVSESGPGNPVACAVQDLAPFRTNRFLRLKVTRP